VQLLTLIKEVVTIETISLAPSIDANKIIIALSAIITGAKAPQQAEIIACFSAVLPLSAVNIVLHIFYNHSIMSLVNIYDRVFKSDLKSI
jgi:hypothetical protein